MTIFFYIIIMVNKERHIKFYDLFKQNGWNGLLNINGGAITLSDFVKQDISWDNDIDNIYSIDMWNTFIQNKADQFAEWAIKQPLNNLDKKKDLVNWFKGIIGEYFYVENGEDLMKQTWDALGKNYAIEHIVPASFYRLTPHTRIEFGEDFGVDAIGINRHDLVSVIQIKTWNIWSKELITYGDVVTNLFMDGICREWITKDQEESMFVLWLGQIKNIAKPLQNPACPAYNKVHYFGFDQLSEVLAGYERFFALSGNFKDSLKNIKNYSINCDSAILTVIDTL